MTAALVTSAHAGSRGFEEQSHVEGLFYGDFEGTLLFAGATPTDFCTGNEPTHAARVFERRDGSIETKVDGSEQPLWLYSSDLGAPDLISMTCDALFDDDPTTVPPEPIAEGEGRVRMRITEAPDGTKEIVNSTVGFATSSDGTTWRVHGWADLVVGDAGPIGDPADFQGLRLRRTGS